LPVNSFISATTSSTYRIDSLGATSCALYKRSGHVVEGDRALRASMKAAADGYCPTRPASPDSMGSPGRCYRSPPPIYPVGKMSERKQPFVLALRPDLHANFRNEDRANCARPPDVIRPTCVCSRRGPMASIHHLSASINLDCCWSQHDHNCCSRRSRVPHANGERHHHPVADFQLVALDARPTRPPSHNSCPGCSPCSIVCHKAVVEMQVRSAYGGSGDAQIASRGSISCGSRTFPRSFFHAHPTTGLQRAPFAVTLP